jgi:raffinose/stachyose/melibiose transport system substrate-binding protein
MKKVLSTILIMAIGLSTVFAQGAKEGESSTKPVKLTVMINQSRYYDGLQLMFEKLKAEENIEIEPQVIPDDQYLNLVKIKINTGEAADLVDIGIPDHYAFYDTPNVFADLSNEEWVNKLTKKSSIEYKDGNIYGYPFQAMQGFNGWVYNKDIFNKYGLAEPTSWEEFVVVCNTLRDKGETAIHYCKDTWVPQIFMSAGFARVLGNNQDAVGRELIENKKQWTDIAEFSSVIDTYLSFFNNGWVNDDFLSVTYDDSISAIADGTAAMACNGDWFANSVLEANESANIGMFNLYLPNAKEDFAIVVENSIGLAINKNSKNVDAAKKVLNLFSTPEYGNLWFTGRSGFSAIKEINSGKTPSYLDTINTNYIKTGKYMNEFNGKVGECKVAMIDSLWIYYLEAASKQNMDGEQLLTKFQGDFDKYMSDNQYPNF